MSKILALLISLLIGIPVLAQTAAEDTIAQRLAKEPNDRARFAYLLDRSRDVSYTDPSLGIRYANRAIDYATNIDSTLGKAHAWLQLGNCYDAYNVSDKSMESYIHALELFMVVNDSNGIGLAHNNMGIVQLDEENNQQAYDHLIIARTYFEAIRDTYDICMANHNLGSTYEALGRSEDALEVYRTNLVLQKSLRSRIIEAVTYNNIGWLYFNKNQNDSAILYLTKALRVKRGLNRPGKLANTMLNLADVYLKMGDTERSYQFADTALQLASAIDDRRLAYGAMESMAHYYEAIGDPEQALQWFHRFNTLKDSIETAAQHERIADLEAAFQLTEKELEIDLLNEAQAQQESLINTQWWLMALLSVLFLAAIGLGIGLLVSSNRRKQTLALLEQQNAEIKSQSDTIMHQNEVLSEKNATLEELYREIQGMTQMAAHDLKAPLHRASSLAELVASQGNLKPDQLHLLGLIRKIGEDGHELIQDLLDLSKIEGYERELPTEELAVCSLVRTAADGYAGEAQKKDIALTIEPTDAPCMATLNRQALQRIIENLLSNAIKFSPQGGHVTIASIKEQGLVKISVKDDGPGILPEERKLLFKKFQRLSNKPTGGESSTGLGLAITKTLVDRLHGNIVVSSSPGEGTEFIVAFPADMVAEAAN